MKWGTLFEAVPSCMLSGGKKKGCEVILFIYYYFVVVVVSFQECRNYN